MSEPNIQFIYPPESDVCKSLREVLENFKAERNKAAGISDWEKFMDFSRLEKNCTG